jgi:adenine-specific DNA-methyltransferase
MRKRLNLAKNLLTDEGIICVTIDDYEIPRLIMIMEEIFGEENHLGTVVIKNNPSGRSTEKGFSIAHEYALFFARSEKAKIGRLERNEDQIARYKEKDKNGVFEWVNFRKHGSTRAESPRMFYPIFLTKDSIRIPKLNWNETKQEWIILEKPRKNETVSQPIDEDGHERRWKWSIERARDEISEMKIGKDRNGEYAVYIKSRMNDEGMLPLTWWDKKEYSATTHGTNLLKTIFSKLNAFSYPKSLYAVMDCLKVMASKKDAIILDFFAGSGTTGHAVLQLNKEDKGTRQFILVTNNENNNGTGTGGIAESVCYPRIKKVISGYKTKDGSQVHGLGSSLKYFKTKFVKKNSNGDDFKMRITNECTEMLCLREGVFNEIKKTASYRIFQQGDKTLAVYYSLTRTSLPVLKKELDKIGGEKILYCFTLDPVGLSKSEFIGWHSITLEPIPQKILDVYKQIYEY